MNAITQGEPPAKCLVEIIQLKWLMAGQGVRVHVEQLQNDSEYARRVIALAAAAPNASLREAAEKLRLLLGLQAD